MKETDALFSVLTRTSESGEMKGINSSQVTIFGESSIRVGDILGKSTNKN